MSDIMYGPIPTAAQADPNGVPGQTKGGVTDRLSQGPPVANEANPGSYHLVPPYLRSARRTPLATAPPSIAIPGE